MDVDGDGRVDACAVDRFGRVVVWDIDVSLLTPAFVVSPVLTAAFANAPLLLAPTYAPLDFDLDGDVDVVVASRDGSVKLLANTAVQCLAQCNGHGVCVNSPTLTVLAEVRRGCCAELVPDCDQACANPTQVGRCSCQTRFAGLLW